jgi:hypothetical protein
MDMPPPHPAATAKVIAATAMAAAHPTDSPHLPPVIIRRLPVTVVGHPCPDVVEHERLLLKTPMRFSFSRSTSTTKTSNTSPRLVEMPPNPSAAEKRLEAGGPPGKAGRPQRRTGAGGRRPPFCLSMVTGRDLDRSSGPDRRLSASSSSCRRRPRSSVRSCRSCRSAL